MLEAGEIQRSNNVGRRRRKKLQRFKRYQEGREKGRKWSCAASTLLTQISQHLFVKFCCTMNMVSAKLKHLSLPKYSHSGTATGDYILGLFFIAVCLFVFCISLAVYGYACICVTREGAAEKVKNKHPKDIYKAN